MKRKEFISITTKTLLGLVIANSFLISCFLEGQDLSKIIGMDINNLKNLKTEYKGKISCYSLLKFHYKIDGEKVFIFCINNKIVGFSIKIKNKTPLTEIVTISNNKKIAFDNPFGTRTVWKEENIYKSLSIPKDYQSIENYIFYAEYLQEASTIIW